MKRALNKIRILFILVPALCMVPANLRPDPTAGVPASENILLIYTSTTAYAVSIKDAFRAALSAIVPAPTFTELEISAGDGTGPGIYDELVAQTGQTDLSSWCQVYDLRFRDDRNNLAFTGQDQEDVVTYIGANNDHLLYRNYLNMGGSLFMQGEHHDYYIRNTNLLLFINAVATAPIPQTFVDVFFGASTANTFSATPENFNTDFNNLVGGSINTNFMGGINTGGTGSGRPLVTWGGNEALMLAWLPGDLNTTSGRLVVSFETNAFTEPALQNATSDAIIQNVYDLLSGCRRYEVTKQFTPAGACVGEAASFTICYENTGTRALDNMVIEDDIPTCLSFNSSSPSPSGVSGSQYSWNVGSIAPGASGCVTVQFTVTAFPPCP